MSPNPCLGFPQLARWCQSTIQTRHSQPPTNIYQYFAPISTSIRHQYSSPITTNHTQYSQYSKPPTTNHIARIFTILQCRISTCYLLVFIAAALALAGGVSYLRGRQDESQLPLLLITNQPNPAPFPYFHLLFR